MTRIKPTFAWAVVLALAMSLLATVALASVTTITSVPSYPTISTQSGWTAGKLGSGKQGITYYADPCRGNPGPAPMGHFYLKPGQDGGGANNPGQSWVGTNKFEGIKLRDIASLSYWAIVDMRGDENTSLLGWELDANGNRKALANEWEVKWYTAQPPSMVLFIQISSINTSMRQLIWRGWDDGNLVSRGPRDGRYCRQWRQYNPMSQGLWYDPMGPAPKFYTWEQLLGVYGGSDDTNSAFLHNPAVGTTWGVANCPTGTSFNLEMGAMKLTNNDFIVNGVDFTAWWMETWNSSTAVDLVQFAYYQSDNSIVDETFDFQSTGNLSNLVPKALNCAAMYPGKYLYQFIEPNAWYPNYGPEPRTRKHYTGSALIPWGENDVTTLTPPFTDPVSLHTFAEQAKQTALQRNGQYNRSMFVLYGKVADKDTDGAPANPDGNYFYVTDGSNALATDGSYQLKFVRVNCPTIVPMRGQYLRMVGTPAVPSIWDWRYNMFHIRTPGNPNAVPPTENTYWGPYEAEFVTFPWNVTQLDQ